MCNLQRSKAPFSLHTSFLRKPSKSVFHHLLSTQIQEERTNEKEERAPGRCTLRQVCVPAAERAPQCTRKSARAASGHPARLGHAPPWAPARWGSGLLPPAFPIPTQSCWMTTRTSRRAGVWSRSGGGGRSLPGR